MADRARLAIHVWLLLASILAPRATATRAAEQQPPPDGAPRYDRFEIPIDVDELPPRAALVPIQCEINFGPALHQLGQAGLVDERSLRLFHVTSGGQRREQPVQLVARQQPRTAASQPALGAATGAGTSAEPTADERRAAVTTAGQLWWIAQADDAGQASYRLQFGVLRGGRTLQVPYPPADWRMFDDQDRATPLAYFPRMQIRPQWPLDGVLHVTEDGRLVTSYHLGPTGDPPADANPTLRRPFLYPVNGPDGISLTEFGKSHDPTGSHRHHYSLWIAHNRVAGHDFWADTGGLILHRDLVSLEDGPIFCRLVARTRWRDGAIDLLAEQRSLTIFTAGDDCRLMDVDLVFQPAGAEPIELGRTTFGFLAARVAQSLSPFDGGGEIRNSRGQRNEQNVHLQRAEWLDQSGPIRADRWSGIAILDHPANPNHPTLWHCRNDGWAGASFCGDQPFAIEPQRPLRLRYRLVLHGGDATNGRVAEHWSAYAAMPRIQLGEPSPTQ